MNRFTSCEGSAILSDIVMIPVLPPYIAIIRMILLKAVRFAVIPRESPEVPIADITSKVRSLAVKMPFEMFAASVIKRQRMMIPKNEIAFTRIEAALSVSA